MSIGETRTCAREGCTQDFVSKTSNQKYHDDECCRLATNAIIMKKYYAKKEQLSGKARYCNVCETTKLSRYNDTLVCNSCDKKTETALNRSVSDMLVALSW